MNGVAKPHVGIFAALAQVQRHVVRRSNARGELHVRLLVVAPVLVWRVNQIVVPWRGQSREVVGKPIAFDEDHVVRVHHSNAVCALHVQRPKRVATRKVPVGFVEQVVPRHPGLVHIVLCDALPQGSHFVSVLDAFPQGRLGRIVVGNGRVVALSTRRRVQVQNHVHLALFAPLDQAVRQLKTEVKPGVLVGHRFLFNGQSEEVVVHGQSNRVEPPRFHRVDVRFAAMVVQPRVVKLRRGLFPNQFGDGFLDFMLGAGEGRRLQHVPLLHHPAAQAHATQQHIFTVAVDNGRAARGQKSRVLGPRRPWHQGEPQGAQKEVFCKLDHDRIVRCEGKIRHEFTPSTLCKGGCILALLETPFCHAPHLQLLVDVHPALFGLLPRQWTCGRA